MSKACHKCGKEIDLIENKYITGDESVCNDCQEQESLGNNGEKQKDMLHRVAGAYSHIADSIKGKW